MTEFQSKIIGQHYLGGEAINEGVYSRANPDMDFREIKERIAEQQGTDPNTIILGQEVRSGAAANNPTARKLAVAFSARRWKATWDPKAPKGDPSQN